MTSFAPEPTFQRGQDIRPCDGIIILHSDEIVHPLLPLALYKFGALLPEKSEGIGAPGDLHMQATTAFHEEHGSRINAVLLQCSDDVGVLVREEAHRRAK